MIKRTMTEEKIFISFEDDINRERGLIDTYMEIRYWSTSLQDVIYTTDPANDVCDNHFLHAIKAYNERKEKYLADPHWIDSLNQDVEEGYQDIKEEYQNIQKLKFRKEGEEIYIVGGGWKLKFPDDGSPYLEVIEKWENLKDVFLFLEILLTDPWL